MAKRIRKALTLLLLLYTFGAVASASLVATIADPNAAISSYPEPYAEVYITLSNSNTTANIMFVGLTSGSYHYLLGGEDAADLNINGKYTVTTAPTETNSLPGFTLTPSPTVGSGNTSDFGSFNLSVKNFDGFGHAAETISFSITKDAGHWSSPDDVLTANSAGFIAAAHIFVTQSPYTSALNTGFAGNGNAQEPPPDVPEPGTILLTGAGLISVAWIRQKQKARS